MHHIIFPCHYSFSLFLYHISELSARFILHTCIVFSSAECMKPGPRWRFFLTCSDCFWTNPRKKNCIIYSLEPRESHRCERLAKQLTTSVGLIQTLIMLVSVMNFVFFVCSRLFWIQKLVFLAPWILGGSNLFLWQAPDIGSFFLTSSRYF